MKQVNGAKRIRRRRLKRSKGSSSWRNDPLQLFIIAAIGILVIGVCILVLTFPSSTASIGNKNEHYFNKYNTNTSSNSSSSTNDEKEKKSPLIVESSGSGSGSGSDSSSNDIENSKSTTTQLFLNKIAQSNDQKSNQADVRQSNNNNVTYDSDFPINYLGSSTLDKTKPYKPLGSMRFTEWKDGQTPYTITQSLIDNSNTVATQRKEHIKNAMKYAWDGYKTYAFGYDEILPVSGKTNTHWGGIGTTLIDALDTLWIMDMKDEFWDARDWVRDKLNQDVDVDASVFETTIRSLGGLLSAYYWSKDEVFLIKAKDMGDRLYKAFQRGHGIPYELVNLKSGRGSVAGWLGSKYIISEMGTLQVEFRELARITGEEKYAKSAEHVFELLKEIEPSDGLYPYFLSINGSKLRFATNDISFGAFGDSFFEYELKIWLQGGKKEPMYREMYDKSMDGMHSQLLHKSSSGLWYIGTRRKPSNFDHLTCFMGGLLALGAYTDPRGLESERAQRDLQTAKRLAYTCYQMYAQMPTGLAPDVISFSGRLRGTQDFSTLSLDYGLRPETVETFYILNKLTNDPIYRTWGWEIFQAIESYCKTKYAYGKHPNVKNVAVSPDDAMESFFMGETMKYLYLLNDPSSEVDILNKHVFNTEAHPLPVFLHNKRN